MKRYDEADDLTEAVINWNNFDPSQFLHNVRILFVVINDGKLTIEEET